MSNPENTNSPAPVSPQPLRTWDFMETAFVSLIAYGVYTLTSGLALTIMLAMHDGAKTLSPAQIQGYGAPTLWQVRLRSPCFGSRSEWPAETSPNILR
jgi:uncharacterized protein